jgi:hypothetical protein
VKTKNLSLIDLYGTDQGLTEEDIVFYHHLLDMRERVREMDRWSEHMRSLEDFGEDQSGNNPTPK